jgi:hypothetical protein
MNEIFDLWSLPWHAFQRSLAETFRAEAGASALMNPKPLIPQITHTTGGNWLTRTRGGAAPAPWASP